MIDILLLIGIAVLLGFSGGKSLERVKSPPSCRIYFDGIYIGDFRFKGL